MELYDIVTREMGISPRKILESPSILQMRAFVIRERHGFLKTLGRAQYDEEKDLFVPLASLIIGTNRDFAVDVAKSTYEEYDRFLRTL